ncbi:MAG TPA: respiratory nitrate reductase subunit gamma [Syntrophorhabdales bacterium]|nr:respiratory nitrate reductase subunit gamma [Syntrophorhabdales bacterium]
MGALVVVLFYGSILFCIVFATARLIRIYRLPLHIKWEFYRDSSVYEQVEWWTKPQIGFWQKAGAMMLDVLFLRDYYDKNRGFWIYLYTFHVGIYLLIVWHAWLFLVAPFVDPETASSVGLFLGHVATALAFVGGLSILIKRATDEELSVYYPPIHYVKWVAMLLTLASGFYAIYFYFNNETPALLKYVQSQVTFSDLEHKLHPPPATATHVLFASIWLVYLPYSHIMRLFLRYYHYLHDDEVPNVRGGEMEKRIGELLGQQVSWSAPHIQTGKSWAEVATTPAPKNTSKEQQAK